jgi:hypothetical protein
LQQRVWHYGEYRALQGATLTKPSCKTGRSHGMQETMARMSDC